MTKHNVIFLDCDGVLNRACLNGDIRYFVPECFHAFVSVVLRTGAKIVLSSSWRTFPDWYRMLCDFFAVIGIEIVGKTRDDGEGTSDRREDQIRDYLSCHADEIENYVVIDDWDMREAFPDHCVCTSEPGRIGLDAKWAGEAVAILKGKRHGNE